MYDKCIACPRIGRTCVPNLMILPFPELIQWCVKRQKHLGWTNQAWADNSKVPVGTINRIKAGDYADCKYSTIRGMVIAVIGGTSDEFPCTELVEQELQQLEQRSEHIAEVEKTAAELKAKLDGIDEQHRADIRAIRNAHAAELAESKEQIAFLRDEVKAWRSVCKCCAADQ